MLNAINLIDAFFPIIRSVTSLEEAMKCENAERNMENTAEQVFRLYAKACNRSCQK